MIRYGYRPSCVISLFSCGNLQVTPRLSARENERHSMEQIRCAERIRQIKESIIRIAKYYSQWKSDRKPQTLQSNDIAGLPNTAESLINPDGKAEGCVAAVDNSGDVLDARGAIVEDQETNISEQVFTIEKSMWEPIRASVVA